MREFRQFFVALTSLLLLSILTVKNTHAQNETNSPEELLAPLPKILLADDGTLVEDASFWEQHRREEILELFRKHVYGINPESEPSIEQRVTYLDRNALEGKAIMKEVELIVNKDSESLTITMLIFLPKQVDGPAPLFLGLNFCGNQSIHPDPGITLPQTWVMNNTALGISENRATQSSRGGRHSRWPVELILSRGYGLATISYGDIDPDFDDGFKNGIHGVLDSPDKARDESSWGSIGAWAWGLSRAMDYLEGDEEIDRDRVAVIGHSRLGKTSIWAGAQDERFALVISNNSGCGGAALSLRGFGETVGKINSSFPHWFCDRFKTYSNNEAALPVDQHMLLSLIAPRPLYVASATEDQWADPFGEYLSLYHGSKAYELYGHKALKYNVLPPPDQPIRGGNTGYHLRSGKHDLTVYDWEQYLDFADEHMAPAKDAAEGHSLTREWIELHLKKEGPRLILTPDLERQVREQIEKEGSLSLKTYEWMQLRAQSILDKPLLTYEKTGRRLLGVSREAVSRLSTLALVYRIERDEALLKRLEEELMAVCTFPDWNPSHFLDVAEMAAGISLALDWAGEFLSPEVHHLAMQALIEKALKEGTHGSGNNFFTTAHHNWNLVCNGGLSLAALTVFEEEPELASAILDQAVNTIPLALEPYAPGGIYPEGVSYWFYATTYLSVAISAYETALGTDFGFSSAPGIMESAIFSQVLAGPSGEYYNFFDSGLGGFHSMTHFGMLAWFSVRSDEGMDWAAFETMISNKESAPTLMKGTRFFATHFLNCAALDMENRDPFIWPETWSGGGEEPLVVCRDAKNGPDAFFLAAKGGMAGDNHGNMDAGSFVFELDGVRWSVDPGNQNYHALEEIMGHSLWDNGQDSRRWSLLTKNNFGHSTLTINGEKHRVNGRSGLVHADVRSSEPSFTFDVTPVFGSGIQKVERRFTRLSHKRFRVRDVFVFSPETKNLTWQMMTLAEAEVVKEGVILRQDGKELFLEIKVGVPYQLRVVELSPPPLEYDKDIPGLKRIEIFLERSAFEGDEGEIAVELSSGPKG